MRTVKLIIPLLLMLFVSIGNVWGAEGDEHDFTQTLSQLLNNSASISSINIAEQTYPIKEVKVTWNYNKSINPAVTISVSVGSTSFGSAGVGTSTTSTTSFTSTPQSSLKGATTVSFVNNCGSGTGKGTFKVTKVTLVEGSSSGGSGKTTITLNANGKGQENKEVQISQGASSVDEPREHVQPLDNTGWELTGYTTAANNDVYVIGRGSSKWGFYLVNNYTTGEEYNPQWAYTTNSNLTLFAQWDATAITAPTGLSESGVSAMGATLNWTAVTGAASYTVSVMGDDGYDQTFPNITETSKTISGLTAGTNYYWTVRAIANTANGYTGNPESDTKDFTTVSSSSHSVTWMVNGSAYTTGSPTTLVSDGGKVSTLPTAPADNTLSCATTFMGWSESNLGSTTGQSAPGDLFTDAAGSPTINSPKTFYAVFATASSGEEGYYNVTSLTAGKTYVFGAVKAAASSSLAANTAIAAINFTSTSSWGSYTTLTPNTSGAIAASSVTNNNLKWELVSITDGAYVFKSGTNYLSLGASTGASTAGVSTTSASVYLENVNSTCKNAFLMHPTSSSTNKLLCNTGNSYGYRMYASSTSASASMCPYIRFYEYDPGANTNYVTECSAVLPTCATPTFSPAAGEYATTQSVSISCTTPGVTIYYTTDGSTPTTGSSVYSSAIEVAATTTIKAIAVKASYNNSEVAEATYTITPPAPGDAYTLVTSVGQLNEGDLIIISTNNNYSGTMKTAGTVSSNLLGCFASTYNGDKTAITSPASGTIVFTLGGNSDDGWTLKSGDNYLKMSGDKKVEISAGESTWNITITKNGDAYEAAISQYVSSQSKTYTINYNYNTDNDRFTGYASGVTPVSIYHKESTAPNVAIAGSLSEFSYVVGNGPSAEQTFTVSGANLTGATITVTPPSGYEISKTSGSGFQTSAISLDVVSNTVAETTLYIRLAAGKSKGTYNGNITVASAADSKEKTLAVTGSVSNPKHTLTMQNDGNGSTSGGSSIEETLTKELTATPNTGYEFDHWEIVSGSGAALTTTTATPTTFTMGTENATVKAYFHPIKVTGITLTATELVKKTTDGYIEFTATVTPANALDKEVEWSSDDENVAVYVDGYIYFVGEGHCTITATAHDGGGASATCDVTVQSGTIALKLNNCGNVTDLGSVAWPYALPANQEPTCDEGWMFVGWTATPIGVPTNVEPTLVSAASVAGTYYAVYAKLGGSQSSTTFERVTDLSQLRDGRDIAFVEEQTGRKFLTTSCGIADAPAESNGKITISAATNYWTLVANSTNWKIKTGTNYLTTGSPVSTNATGNVWTIANSLTTDFYFVKSSTAYLEYYGSKWQTYTINSSPNASQNGSVKLSLYVRQNSYENYTTNPCVCAYGLVTSSNNGGSWENGGCFVQENTSTTWLLEDVTLSANNSNNRIKVQKDGADISGKTQSWQTGWIPFAGLQNTAATYKTLADGADGAVGTLRIYSDNNDNNANKYLAFIPTYQITHGVDGGGAWGSVPFAWVEGSKYETEVQTAPAGYFSNGDYKYYVGVKNSSNTTNFIPNISETRVMNAMTGMTSSREGQRGKWRMYDNSTDKNWYVSWVPYYTITYKSYDGETTLYTDEVEGSVSTTLRTAYNSESNGWATAPNSNTQNYAGGAEVTPSDNMVLYVSLKAYNVTYALAGGSNGCSNTTAIAGETVNVCASTPEKAGNVFKGWKRSDNSEIVAVSGSFTMPAASVTLTAQWAAAHAITYTIPTGGGAVAVGAPASVEDNTTFTMPGVTGIAAEYDCETLIGWTTNSAAYENTNGVKPTPFYAVGGTSPTITGPTTFYAVYSRPGLGASGDVSLTSALIERWKDEEKVVSNTIAYGVERSFVDANSYTWTTTARQQGNDWTWAQLGADNNSAWIKVPTFAGDIATITVNLRNASGNDITSANLYFRSSNDGANIVTGSIPSGEKNSITIDLSSGSYNTGYLVAGTNMRILGMDIHYGPAATISTTLDCDNSIDQFSITYDANTAQFAGSQMTCSNAVNYKFSENGGSYTICENVTYTEDGATFLYWNNQADGQGSISYTAGQEITSISDDNLTLYAQWAYNVNKSDNGSGAVVHPETVGGYVVLPDGAEVCDPQKYDFIGWTTAETASWDNNIYAPALIAEVGGECRYTPTEPNTTVFAVYAQSTAVGSQAFYIGYEADGHDYYMKSNLKVSAADATAEACSYYLEDVNPSNNEYLLYYVDGGVKTYVYYTGSSLSTTTTSNVSNAWVITNDGDVYIFQSKSYSTRYLSYSGTSFTTHAAANRQDLKIYSGAPAYKYLARTTCTDEATVIYRSGGGSITPIKTSEVVHIGESVTLPTCEYTGWTFRGWVDHAVNEVTDEAIADANIYTGTYEVGGNVTLYAYYTKTPEAESFDGTESGEYKMYYNAGAGTYRYADAQTTSSGTTGEYQTFTRCSLGETWTFTNVATNTYTIQAENGKYLQGGDANNDLTLGNDPMLWTVTEQDGKWRIKSETTERRVLGFLTGATPHLENMASSQIGNASYTLPLIGTCVDPIYTTNPGAQKSIRLNGNVKVTSTQGISVWGANKLTLGLEGMTPYTNVSITATDGFTFLQENGSAWTGTVTESDGSLNVQVTVVYTPTSYNLNNVNPTITVTCGGEEEVFTNLITGRSLPEKFVIAQQVGGEWYALPNTMTSTQTNPVPVKVSVEGNVATVREHTESDATWALGVTNRAGAAKSLVMLQKYGASTYLATNTSDAATLGLITAQSGDGKMRQEFLPMTTDLTNYTLKNEKWAKYLGVNTNWGIYSEEATVRFFEYNRVEPETDVTFDPNDGVANGCTGYSQLAYGTSPAVCHNQSRDGYTFDGYTVTQNGTDYVFDADGTMQDNVAGYTDASGKWAYTGETLTLYAHWTPIVYNIMYNLDGGTNGANPDSYTIETADITLQDATKDGYSFDGWYTESTFDNKVVGVAIATGSTGNKEFWAKWTRNHFTVTYHHGDGTTSVEEVNEGETPVGVAAKTCSADRVFVGWSESEITTAVQTAPATVDPTTVTITAAKDFYAVYASKNGGKVTGTRHIVEDFETMESSIGNDNKNYTHDGISWTTTKGTVASPSSYTHMLRCMPTSTSNTRYIYTSGISDVLSVSFKAMKNYGNINANVEISTKSDFSDAVSRSIAMGGNNLLYPQEIVLSDLSINGSDKDIYFGITAYSATDFTKYLYIDDVDFTIAERAYYYTDYATSCEKAASMTLTYDAQGGTAQTAVTEAGWVTLPDGDACERGCYTLTGWLCSGDAKTYEPGAKYLFNHDVTMTAQWSVNGTELHDVTYYTGQEGDDGTTIQVACGEHAVIADPTSCDDNRYHFEGWTTNGTYAESTTAPELFDIATQQVLGDMELYAVWSHGKNTFTQQTAEYPVSAGDKIIIVEPTNKLALTSLLLSTPVEATRTDVIETDETIFVWDVIAAAGGKLTLRGTNGNLHIGANTTNSLEVLDNDDYATATYKGFEIRRSATRIYAITQSVAADKTRRVNYNKKKGIWNTYATNTAGYIYKKTATDKIFSLDGYCAHEYLATGVSEMTSGKNVSVLAAEVGNITVSHTDKVPVAEKISGDNVFEVIVNSTSTGTNFDESKNYSYRVKFTPTAANTEYTATYRFVGTGESVGDTKVIPSAEITFTGYSLPDEFAIVAQKNGQYYALPGNVASAMETAAAVPVDVIDGSVVNLDDAHKYVVYTGNRLLADQRSTVRLKTTTGALWASGSSTSIQNYSGSLTDNTTAANTLTQWTLERAYNENTDAFIGYHLISNANTDKGLFYQSGVWGYYDNSRYGGEYSGEIFFLPIMTLGQPMDVVDWTSNKVVLNVTNLNPNQALNAKVGTAEYGSALTRNADRTVDVSVDDMTADEFLHLAIKHNGSEVSNYMYKIPHIVSGSATSSSLSLTPTSVILVKSGTLTVNANLTVNAIYVYPGAKLLVNNGITLKADKVVLRGEAWQHPNLENKGTITAKEYYYTRRIADKIAHYQFGLPYDVAQDAVHLSNNASLKYMSSWTLKYYNAADRAESGYDANGDGSNNWEYVAMADPTTHSGPAMEGRKGYEFWSNSAYYREFCFPFETDKLNAASTPISLDAHTGAAATADPIHGGWNYVVSPLTYDYTVTSLGGSSWTSPSEQPKLAEMYEDGRNYYQFPVQGATIRAFSPFYYQAASDGEMTFGAGGALSCTANYLPGASFAPARQAEEQLREQWIQLFVEDANGTSDQTNIYIKPQFSVAYETGLDVVKMSTTGERPFVYVQLPCGNLAFAAIPDSLAETRIPLAVNAAAAGEMTFSLRENDWLDRMEHVYLLDDSLGFVTDLLESDYTYEATAGTVTGRFALQTVFRAPSITTDISEVDDGGGQYDIRVQDGHVIVSGLGRGEEIRLYDAVGRLLMQQKAEQGVALITPSATGVYLLQVGDMVNKVVLDK